MSDSIIERAATVLVAHTRVSIEACACGWSELGHSHPEHQARMLAKAGLLRAEVTDEMVERAALAICNESRRRTGLSPLDRLPWAHSTRRHRGEASAALEAALGVAS